MDPAEADFLSEPGFFFFFAWDTNWFRKTDRKREIEQEKKGAQEQLHVHLQLLVLLV